ncbi:hypothetical protein ACQPW1_04360 [Nocardia sp. CA-128927]
MSDLQIMLGESGPILRLTDVVGGPRNCLGTITAGVFSPEHPIELSEG